MSAFWSGWIIILSVANILGCFWLIWWTMRRRTGEAAGGPTPGRPGEHHEHDQEDFHRHES